MAFIRTKKIKGAEYAYIVENQWKRKGKKVKQKSKKYLGRVYRFDRANLMDFAAFYNIDDINDYVDRATVEKILVDLIKLELFNYGFKEAKEGIWQRECCFFDLKKKKFITTKANQ